MCGKKWLHNFTTKTPNGANFDHQIDARNLLSPYIAPNFDIGRILGTLWAMTADHPKILKFWSKKSKIL